MLRRLLGGAAIGAATWTATEYSVHRWAMHGRKGANAWSEEHLDHHAKPYRTFPLELGPDMWMKVAGVPAVGLPVAAVAGAVAGRKAALALGPAAGLTFAACYAGYTASHHAIHHRPPRSELGRTVRRHHLAHHFAAPKRNFGVTAGATVWDAILRSGSTPVTVKVPRRLAPDWLLDGRGELRPEYAVDYQLAGRIRRPVEDVDVAAAMDDRVPAIN